LTKHLNLRKFRRHFYEKIEILNSLENTGPDAYHDHNQYITYDICEIVRLRYVHPRNPYMYYLLKKQDALRTFDKKYVYKEHCNIMIISCCYQKTKQTTLIGIDTLNQYSIPIHTNSIHM